MKNEQANQDPKVDKVQVFINGQLMGFEGPVDTSLDCGPDDLILVACPMTVNEFEKALFALEFFLNESSHIRGIGDGDLSEAQEAVKTFKSRIRHHVNKIGGLHESLESAAKSCNLVGRSNTRS